MPQAPASVLFDQFDDPIIRRLGLVAFIAAIVAVATLTVALPVATRDMPHVRVTPFIGLPLLAGLLLALAQCWLWFMSVLAAKPQERRRHFFSRELAVAGLLVVLFGTVMVTARNAPVSDALILYNLNGLHTQEARQSYVDALRREAPFTATASAAALATAVAIDRQRMPPITVVPR